MKPHVRDSVVSRSSKNDPKTRLKNPSNGNMRQVRFLRPPQGGATEREVFWGEHRVEAEKFLDAYAAPSPPTGLELAPTGF